MEVRIAIGEIRRGCGRPNDVELSDADILMELWQVVTYYRSRLNLTGESWDIKRWNLNVPAGTAKQGNITPTDFNSAFLIRTFDTDSNPYFIERTVDIIKPEQMSKFYNGTTDLITGSSWYGKHAATAMAPFNEGGQWKMLWSPAHTEAATYTVWYSPGANIVPPLFEDNTLFPIEESNWLFIADCIYNLIPHLAGKEGLTPKQQLLMEGAKKKVQQYDPVFTARSVDGPRHEGTTRRKIWGTGRGRRM